MSLGSSPTIQSFRWSIVAATARSGPTLNASPQPTMPSSVSVLTKRMFLPPPSTIWHRMSVILMLDEPRTAVGVFGEAAVP